MEFFDVLNSRKSVRSYTEQQVDKKTVEKLLTAAVQAPSTMNSQPWAFAVIQDTNLLQTYSDQAKKLLLESLEKNPLLSRYKEALANPDYNIFYAAPLLVVFCAKKEGPSPEADCCLAAENFMLAAHALGLGTCWIGFAQFLLSQPEIKQTLKIPAEYTVVAPIIAGYPQAAGPAIPKKAPEILSWS